MNRSLTIVGALIIAAVILTIRNFKQSENIITQLQPETTHIATALKTKVKDRDETPVSKISPEVKQRLTAAGFKTDSFIAVRTKKQKQH